MPRKEFVHADELSVTNPTGKRFWYPHEWKNPKIGEVFKKCLRKKRFWITDPNHRTKYINKDFWYFNKDE